MDNLSLLANLPNHVNGKHLNVYRWLDGHHFENHSFNLLVHEVLEYFSCYERSGYSLKGSREKIIQKVESDYFY